MRYRGRTPKMVDGTNIITDMNELYRTDTCGG